MVPANKRYLIRSHRHISKEQLAFLTTFTCSGTKLADILRAMRKEVSGEAHLGFNISDAYDDVSNEKKKILDGCDSNQLIRWFAMRQANEYDFYYDFQLNEINQLTNVFWRDGRMRSDYESFGDLLIHDTTYRTNKYDMICGPFVGMNLHTQNIMFGVGFILNEKGCVSKIEASVVLLADYNPWIIRLYSLKEKWCPVYNKDWFSGGVLSSQRNETTNHSISRRLHKTNGLREFYKCFLDVIGEWRSKENTGDYNSSTVSEYIIGHPTKYFIRHNVRFNELEMVVDCTCKSFGEIGILCSHILRVFIVHNVEKLPNRYIMKRWTKEAMNIRKEKVEIMK
ncbi:protein FAR1-RELATED SEQUENCE 5-like [Spinacia oleracea]|uniref:Protein FAR1-RELATED SEQUENCE 5-like n=1 Tax=Spinacia oleracea TaxID=3562 RepID=A0ABM3RP71_SPIOL|nr:protein FAR1-RELATED SEQUENCE 5-like [Spinacia oleracea]